MKLNMRSIDVDKSSLSDDGKKAVASQILGKIMKDDADERDNRLSVLADLCVEFVDDAGSQERHDKLWAAIVALIDVL